MQVAAEALWRDLLAEVQRVSREIERDTEWGEHMVEKRDTIRREAPSSAAPLADVGPVDVDQSSEDSFPASDPPSWAPLQIGPPAKHVATPVRAPHVER